MNSKEIRWGQVDTPRELQNIIREAIDRGHFEKLDKYDDETLSQLLALHEDYPLKGSVLYLKAGNQLKSEVVKRGKQENLKREMLITGKSAMQIRLQRTREEISRIFSLSSDVAKAYKGGIFPDIEKYSCNELCTLANMVAFIGFCLLPLHKTTFVLLDQINFYTDLYLEQLKNKEIELENELQKNSENLDIIMDSSPLYDEVTERYKKYLEPISDPNAKRLATFTFLMIQRNLNGLEGVTQEMVDAVNSSVQELQACREQLEIDSKHIIKAQEAWDQAVENIRIYINAVYKTNLGIVENAIESEIFPPEYKQNIGADIEAIIQGNINDFCGERPELET